MANSVSTQANGAHGRGEIGGTKARLSPDSGRESDRTDSDTSNSYPVSKSLVGQNVASQASQSNNVFHSQHSNMNGLPAAGFNIQVKVKWSIKADAIGQLHIYLQLTSLNTF